MRDSVLLANDKSKPLRFNIRTYIYTFEIYTGLQIVNKQRKNVIV